jgi:hypothetical protein
MVQKSVTIQLPDDLYERVQAAAEAVDRPFETVLVESIDTLFSHPTSTADVQDLVRELQNYSDPQLWAVVYRRLPWSQALRLRELNLKNKLDTLTETEQSELNSLIEQVDRDMLLRSEALLLLQQRGVNVDTYLKRGA